MSRFLKFIVHLVILCAIVGVLALVVPPFAGIHTTIIDSADMETNLPFGSVTYAKSVPAGSLQAGDSVIVNQDEGVYCYEITGVSEEENSFIVKGKGSEEQTISLKKLTPKVIFSVGYLGFLLVAVQSVEGMIILGLAILFLIILYIIAELWKKEPKKNTEETDVTETAGNSQPEYEEDGSIPLKSKKQLKKEEKERARRMKEEERQMKEEEKLRRKQEKKRKKVIRTGGFIDDLTEEDFYEPKEASSARTAQTARTAVKGTEAENGSAPAEPQAAVYKEDFGKTQVIPAALQKEEMPVQPKEEAAEPVKEAVVSVEEPKAYEPEEEITEPVKPVEIKKMAIPVYTAKELQEKAAAAGDEPDIYQDEESGVTLFDYTKVIIGNEDR